MKKKKQSRTASRRVTRCPSFDWFENDEGWWLAGTKLHVSPRIRKGRQLYYYYVDYYLKVYGKLKSKEIEDAKNEAIVRFAADLAGQLKPYLEFLQKASKL